MEQGSPDIKVVHVGDPAGFGNGEDFIQKRKWLAHQALLFRNEVKMYWKFSKHNVQLPLESLKVGCAVAVQHDITNSQLGVCVFTIEYPKRRRKVARGERLSNLHEWRRCTTFCPTPRKAAPSGWCEGTDKLGHGGPFPVAVRSNSSIL